MIAGQSISVTAPLTTDAADAERIVVRSFGQSSKFALKNAGTTLSLRGINWNRSDWRTLPNGEREWWYRTFDVGAYDANEVERLFAEFQASGYHYVRTFVAGQDPDAGFGRGDAGINPAYLANLADFLRRARAHNLAVTLTGQFATGQWLPKNYLGLTTPDSRVEGSNQLVLNASYARALGRYYQDLLSGLKALPGDPSAAVMAIDIYNEISVNRRERPLSRGSGTFDLAGVTYDLANNSRRQALIDAATVLWLNAVVAAIRQVDGQVLLTTSVFTPAAVGVTFSGASPSEVGDGSGRAPLNPAAIASANVDFLDLHVYLVDPAFSLDADLKSAGGLHLKDSGKPVVMGELGVFKPAAAAVGDARNRVSEVLAKSCGYGFAGWAYWNWNIPGTRLQDTYALTEENGSINAAIAPLAVNTVCAGTSFAAQSVTQSRTAPRFFNRGLTMYYSNGQTGYCAIASWSDFLSMGGKADQSNVDHPARFPADLRDDGLCATPNVSVNGYFRVGAGQSGIFYANGTHYCVYRDWAAYLQSGGRADQANVRILAAPPGGMINDGRCQ